jgi:hypothetical protein
VSFTLILRSKDNACGKEREDAGDFAILLEFKSYRRRLNISLVAIAQFLEFALQ